MTRQQAQEESKQLVDVSRLVPNAWNPNILTGEKRVALKADMKANGPLSIEPLKVCPHFQVYHGKDLTQLLILDGQQRYEIAGELKWEQVWVEVDYSIHDVVSAMLATWRKLYERGSIDGFKEAQFYKTLQEQGLTQKQIAERFGVDQGTVSKRLGLLTLPESIRILMATPKGAKLSISHVESLVGLPEAKVVEISKEVVSEGMSTREVEDEAKRARREVENERKFAEIVAQAKFKVCPAEGCGKPPRAPYHYSSSPDITALECSSGNWQHEWNGKTGETRAQKMGRERAAQAKADLKSKGLEKKLPDYVNSTHTGEEWRAAMVSYLVKEVLPKVDSIKSIQLAAVIGKGDKAEEVEFTFGKDWDAEEGWHLRAEEYSGGDELNLTVGSVSYKAEHLKQYHSQISVRYPKSEKDLHDEEKKALQFLETYSSKAPSKAAKSGPLKREVEDAPSTLNLGLPDLEEPAAPKGE